MRGQGGVSGGRLEGFGGGGVGEKGERGGDAHGFRHCGEEGRRMWMCMQRNVLAKFLVFGYLDPVGISVGAALCKFARFAIIAGISGVS